MCTMRLYVLQRDAKTRRIGEIITLRHRVARRIFSAKVTVTISRIIIDRSWMEASKIADVCRKIEYANYVDVAEQFECIHKSRHP